MITKNALIVFVRNMVPGKVKTRLAGTIGADEATKIYKQLVYLTLRQTIFLDCDKYVFYSDGIDENDLWQQPYHKRLQNGADLGERMSAAALEIFNQGYHKVLIVGTDCPGLNHSLLNEAFERLDTNELVIGPAMDGGYYLLGMKKIFPALFDDIPWSTDLVLEKTLALARASSVEPTLLPVLSDIDLEADLQYLPAMPDLKLVFVYNAQTGWVNGLADFAHKILSPQTYQCQLCSLTYDNLTVKSDWQHFLKCLPFQTQFLYRDEFLSATEFPLIVISRNGKYEPFLSPSELRSFSSLGELMNGIVAKLVSI